MAIRTGLIGFGMAGKAFHAPLIAAVPALELAAIVTSRAEEVMALHPNTAVVADAEALFGDPSIELVVIATPNTTHVPLARAALSAGKHVVIDKPFALDVAEGEALIALAAERQRVLSVYHNRRWDGDFQTVRDVLGGGRLGEVMLAELRWDRFRPVVPSGWRVTAGEGGLLGDLGSHLIDQALQLFGEPDRFVADIATQREGAAVDDYFELTLHYGAHRVILSASTLVAAPRPRFALHGTAGSFVKYGIDPQEAALRAGGSPDAPGYGEEDPAAYGVLTLGEQSEPVPTRRGDWRRFYVGMAEAIATGAPPPVDPRDALAGLRLIEQARELA